jgi:hypothetical protein
MSAQELSTPYGPGAYRSNALPALPPSRQQQGGLFEMPLRWGHYAGLDSPVEVESQLESEVQKAYEQQLAEGRQPLIFCDAQRWRFENSSMIPHLIFISKLLSFFFPWFFYTAEIYLIFDSNVVTLIPCIILMILTLGLSGGPKQKYADLSLITGAVVAFLFIAWDKGALWGYWSEHPPLIWIGILLAFHAIIGADLLLALYARLYKHDGSEFNRQTGTLTIARRFRKPFVAPFYEFDPVMQLLPTGYGGHDYALWLHHRYDGTKVCLARKVHTLGLDKHNLHAFWDTLQRYMDVSQPLPDLPVLEQSRHLDPVTAAHDAATGRNPRKWRDLNVEAWKRKAGIKLREKVAAYPWQKKPCALQARIDPNLTIEAYYRGQEARGIQATPQAEDFTFSRC